MIEAIRWRDDELWLLDQRRLPGKEEWLRCTTADEVAEAIATLAVRGAPLIGIAAAYALALEAQAGRDVTAAGERLAATRPTAVNLRWAVDRVVAAVAERGAPTALPLARAIHAEQADADRALALAGAERFAAGDRVLTHCNAGALATGGYGTALGVIRAAHALGRVELVWVDETRPLLQGARLTAYELARAEIPYRVVTDGSAGILIARGHVDRIVVGADRIAANGDVANKIGTYPLAVLAARHGIPFYVAAPLSTVDPDTPNGDAIEIEERAEDEVLGAAAPAGARALNLAFDVTPAELVTAMVTEAGVLEPPYGPALARAALAAR